MDFNYVVVPALLVVFGFALGAVCVWRVFACRGFVSRVAYGSLAFASVAVAVSSGFNALMLHRFRTAPPGVLYRVDGRAMRMLCVGSGSPTIVLESGLGADGLVWNEVQTGLGQTTRVCSYDRAGYGWSDAGPAPRDAKAIASELHDLLVAAQVDGPIVLMGHSLGGIYIRAFAARYPARVVGLVFVDSSTPWQNRNPAFAAEMRSPSWPRTLVNEFAYAVGVPRLRGKCRGRSEDQCHVPFATIAGELGDFDQSGSETVGSGPFGVPVLIFSQDPAKTAGTAEEGLGVAWNGMQEELKKLSSRSRRVIARGSGHNVQTERPELVAREVARFIEEVRGGAFQGNGSTVTE